VGLRDGSADPGSSVGGAMEGVPDAAALQNTVRSA